MYKNYTVTLRFQFPAWDEKDGYTYEVLGKSKSDAIKSAKRLAEDDGHTCGKGRRTFTAQEVTEETC
jgi:hypothetical protein